MIIYLSISICNVANYSTTSLLIVGVYSSRVTFFLNNCWWRYAIAYSTRSLVAKKSMIPLAGVTKMEMVKFGRMTCETLPSNFNTDIGTITHINIKQCTHNYDLKFLRCQHLQFSQDFQFNLMIF